MRFAAGANSLVNVALYLVEHRLPSITEAELRLFQAALANACARLTARGVPVSYVGSTFLPASQRLLSQFQAESGDVVRRATDSAQAPLARMEVAIDLPNHKED